MSLNFLKYQSQDNPTIVKQKLITQLKKLQTKAIKGKSNNGSLKRNQANKNVRQTGKNSGTGAKGNSSVVQNEDVIRFLTSTHETKNISLLFNYLHTGRED